MSTLIIDTETVPDDTLPDDLKPGPKYGNTKDPKKRKKIDEEWEATGQIKAMSTSPEMNKIVSLQMWSSEAGGFIETQKDEVEGLQLFWHHAFNHSLIVGYNHISFDIPLILMRSMMHGIQPTRPFSLARYRNYPLYDVMQELSGWDMSRMKSQAWWAKRLGVERDKNGIDGSKVYGLYQEGKLHEIHNYCREDVLELKSIFDIIYPYFPTKQ